MVDERGVHGLGDWFVAGGDERVGHVTHEQRDTPTIATPARRAERGVIDEIRGNVHQPDLPHAPRQAPDVAGRSHPEVMIDVNELDDAPFAVDLDMLERGGRAGVGRAERTEATCAREQLLDGFGDRPTDELDVADHDSSLLHAITVGDVPCRTPAAPADAHRRVPAGSLPDRSCIRHVPASSRTTKGRVGVTATDTTTDTTPDTAAAVEEFAGRFLGDLAAVLHAATVVLGDKLGLYRALAELGSATPETLAERTGVIARYVREWLSAQAASEYCHYDPTDGTFHLDEAQAMCLADESSPAFLVGGMAVASSVHKDEDTLTARFRTGEGVGWHEHHHDLFVGTERFFRPAYVNQLVTSWVPALDGVVAKLEAGGRVADIGCGHGASTIELAKAFPQATITGFDYHEASIETARQRAAEAGLTDRVRFEVAAGDEFGGEGAEYDLVCIFDALHDMGDPVGVARHIRSRWPPTARGCWSSHARPTGSRTTSTCWVASSTRRRR